MKNLFGITPNSLYGDQAGSEDATAGRGPLHNRQGFENITLPGLKDGMTSNDPTHRVPHIIADICAARPIHLSVIDGITSMSGGEGPWCRQAGPLKVTTPGIFIVGLNAVSTDAVATAVMGYDDPRAARGKKPFHFCDNHLLLAEESGLGSADPGAGSRPSDGHLDLVPQRPADRGLVRRLRSEDLRPGRQAGGP